MSPWKKARPNAAPQRHPVPAFSACPPFYLQNALKGGTVARKRPARRSPVAVLPSGRLPVLTAIQSLAAAVAITAATLLPVPPACGLGVKNDLLADCQSGGVSCVSSQDDTPASFLEPWEYDEDVAHLQDRLISAVQLDYHASLVLREPRYLRFEIPLAAAAVDDLEFFFPSQDNIVHFRSARRGYAFDFWRNRRRIDAIRSKVGLVQIPVLRNRMSPMKMFETPFDEFGPSAVDVDALIDNGGLGSRPVR